MKYQIRDELLGCLTGSQAEKLATLMFENDFTAQPPLSLMICQLDREYLNGLHEQMTSVAKPFSDYGPFLMRGHYSMNMANQWEPRAISDNPPATLPVQIIRLLGDPAVSRLFELSGAQIKELAELQSAWRMISQQYMADYNAGMFKTFKESKNESRRRYAEMGKIQMSRIEGLLLPHQQELLKTLQRHVGCLRAGLYYMLVYGELGKILEVSREQVEKLHERASRLQKKIEKEASVIEREINRRLIASMDSEHREILERLTGESLELEKGHMELHVEWLQRGYDEASAYAMRMLAPYRALPKVLGLDR